ncbi:MAG: HD domain-containing phosphohydrolase [Thermoleophilia bacterium]
MARGGGPSLRGRLGFQMVVPTLLVISMFSIPALVAWRGLYGIYDANPGAGQDSQALEAVSQLKTALSTVLFSLAATSLAGIAIAAVMARRITRPLRAIDKAAAAYSAGDLSSRVEIRKNDELTNLGKTFNDMASSLNMRTVSLLNEQSKLRSIHQSITDGIVVFGNNGFIVSANPAGEEILDCTEERLAGSRKTGIAELDRIMEKPELIEAEDMVDCWEYNQCGHKECPAYESDDLRCWQQCGTHCHDEIQGSFIQKRDACERCHVYRRNGCVTVDAEADGKSYSIYIGAILDDDGLEEGRLAVLHDMTDERQRARQLGLLYEIANAIALTGSINNSLHTSLQLCIQAMNATSGSIILVDENDELAIAAQSGLPDGIQQDITSNVGDGIAGWVARHGEPLLITNDDPDPRFAGVKNIRDAVCIPIRDENGIVGVLSLNEQKTGAGFTKESLDFLGPVAVQIGMALSRTRLHENVERERVKSTAIVESMGESLCVRAPDRTILFANSAHKKIFGDDCVGKQCYEVYVASDHICRGCPLDRCFDNGDTVRRSHFVMDRMGIRRQLETTTSPVRDADGRISSCIEISRDITEMLRIRDQAESRLNTLTTLFQVSNTLNSSMDLGSIVDNFTESAMNALKASAVSLMMFDDKTNDLVIRSISGETNGWELGIGKTVDVSTYSLNGLVSGVGPFCTTNADQVSPETVPLAPPGSQSILVGRLSSRGKLMGLIVVSSLKRGAFFETESMELFVDIANQVAVAIDNAEMYKRLETTFWSTIRSLAEAIDAKDSYTRGHSDRVADYAEALARRLELEEEMLNAVRCAGYLHDTGKIGIPDAILLKPGKLTDDEYSQIMSHPILSHKIIEPVDFPYDVKPLVMHHHERIDGLGYPDGLVGDEIPLGARIIGVADAYEAMTSDRPYRKALSRTTAMEELKRCAGTQFDVELVDTFIEVLTEDDGASIGYLDSREYD